MCAVRRMIYDDGALFFWCISTVCLCFSFMFRYIVEINHVKTCKAYLFQTQSHQGVLSCSQGPLGVSPGMAPHMSTLQKGAVLTAFGGAGRVALVGL